MSYKERPCAVIEEERIAVDGKRDSKVVEAATIICILLKYLVVAVCSQRR